MLSTKVAPSEACLLKRLVAEAVTVHSHTSLAGKVVVFAFVLRKYFVSIGLCCESLGEPGMIIMVVWV